MLAAVSWQYPLSTLTQWLHLCLPLQGCGLITFKDRSSAAAAIRQLHREYVFPGSDCPMVVEWVDLKKQRPSGVNLTLTS